MADVVMTDSLMLDTINTLGLTRELMSSLKVMESLSTALNPSGHSLNEE